MWFHDGHSMWGGGIMFVFWILLVLALVVLMAWFIRGLPSSSGSDAAKPSSDARAILEQRYAKGEIDREEYLEKLKDLEH